MVAVFVTSKVYIRVVTDERGMCKVDRFSLGSLLVRIDQNDPFTHIFESEGECCRSTDTACTNNDDFQGLYPVNRYIPRQRLMKSGSCLPFLHMLALVMDDLSSATPIVFDYRVLSFLGNILVLEEVRGKDRKIPSVSHTSRSIHVLFLEKRLELNSTELNCNCQRRRLLLEPLRATRRTTFVNN